MEYRIFLNRMVRLQVRQWNGNKYCLIKVTLAGNSLFIKFVRTLLVLRFKDAIEATRRVLKLSKC